ncbi:MAG: hypothetical protein ACI358_08635 [Candidatus Limimorpha sp.]
MKGDGLFILFGGIDALKLRRTSLDHAFYFEMILSDKFRSLGNWSGFLTVVMSHAGLGGVFIFFIIKTILGDLRFFKTFYQRDLEGFVKKKDAFWPWIRVCFTKKRGL